MLRAEVVLRFVHPGVGLLDLLLDLLLHLLLLGLGERRLGEAVVSALAALAGSGRFLFLAALAVVLLRVLFSLDLGDVHFLGTAALDPFTFLALLRVELGKVDLADDLEL